MKKKKILILSLSDARQKRINVQKLTNNKKKSCILNISRYIVALTMRDLIVKKKRKKKIFRGKVAYQL